MLHVDPLALGILAIGATFQGGVATSLVKIISWEFLMFRS